MGFISWIKMFITGVPTPEMAERLAAKDRYDAIMRGRSVEPPTPTRSFWADRPARKNSAAPAAIKPQPVSRAPRAAPKPRARPSIWAPDDSGSSASFTYVDSDGVVTDRTITNWQSDGRYIRGFCLDRRAHRTFLKDRIEDWRA